VLEGGSPDDEEAVVFVHGNPGSSEDWAELVRHTGEFARAIAPDMPGFGRADKPKSFHYTVPEYALQLDALMEALGVRRAHLVLHDFGGAWGMAWAADHPGSLASLTMIDVGILPGYHGHALAVLWALPVIGELTQLLATRAVARQALRRTAPRGLPEEHVERMARDYDAGTKRAVLRMYRAAARRRGGRALRDSLTRFTGPVLVIWGAHDAFVPVRYAPMQRDFWPQAEVHILGESGHWPMLDAPERVREIIVPFLRRAVGR
jgi:pimeloyl-ACP methyl ester carboxylesterase